MINTEKIPVSLRKDALFCCWKYEERDGKQTKVPYNPATGKRAESDNSDTFSDFDTAVKASSKYSGFGVGMFRGVCGIDIDHCINESGTLSAAAVDIIETMNSYTERSPSGSGIHILFKAEGFVYDKAAYYINNQKSGIEVYVYGATNKYLTLTGDALYERRDIAERSADLSIVLDKYMRRKQPITSGGSENTNSCSGEPKPFIIYDDVVLQKAVKAKNADKFNRLWNGDISGYSSQSEADQALCNILAFHAIGDAQTVDRLFRQSALYRPKWDVIHGASTYGQMTVNKACTGKMIAELKTQDDLLNRPYVYSEGDKNKISAPLLAGYIRNDLKYFFTRSGASGVLRYVYSSDGVYRMVSDDIFKGFIYKYIPTELQYTRIVNEVFGQIITDHDRYKNFEMFNADENIINFKNGILHLDTGELKEHTPDCLSTIQIPCNYIVNALAPSESCFNKYLLHLCEDDPESITMLLEFLGLAISNVAGYRSKKCLVLFGPGDTGKTIYRDLIYRLLGDENCASVSLSTLEKRFGTSLIYSKRIAGDGDLSFMTVDELSIFKAVSGGDELFVEFKGKDGFKAKYKGCLLFLANGLPRFGGSKGDEVYNRFMLLPCNNIVPAKEQDPALIEKIMNESEYIISLAVNHLIDFIKRGYRFTVPDCCTKAIAEYKTDNSSVLRFLDECAVTRPYKHVTDKCTTAMTYRVYCAWCKNNNNGHNESKQNFKRIVESAGKGEVKKTNHGNTYYTEFTLTIDCKQEYQTIYGFDPVASGEKLYG